LVAPRLHKCPVLPTGDGVAVNPVSSRVTTWTGRSLSRASIELSPAQFTRCDANSFVPVNSPDEATSRVVFTRVIQPAPQQIGLSNVVIEHESDNFAVLDFHAESASARVRSCHGSAVSAIQTFLSVQVVADFVIW